MSKAIMIADKPIWCAKIMNGDKLIEVRTSKALYKATKKLIEEQGYATFFMYCSKGNKKDWHLIEVIDTDTGKQGYEYDYYIGSKGYLDHCLEGKVVAKFTVRKVEPIWLSTCNIWTYGADLEPNFLKDSCLSDKELNDYFKPTKCGFNKVYGYAYHIEDLVIFDKPKELSEFKRPNPSKNKHLDRYLPVKVPQNFCYVESEE